MKRALYLVLLLAAAPVWARGLAIPPAPVTCLLGQTPDSCTLTIDGGKWASVKIAFNSCAMSRTYSVTVSEDGVNFFRAPYATKVANPATVADLYSFDPTYSGGCPQTWEVPLSGRIARVRVSGGVPAVCADCHSMCDYNGDYDPPEFNGDCYSDNGYSYLCADECTAYYSVTLAGGRPFVRGVPVKAKLYDAALVASSTPQFSGAGWRGASWYSAGVKGHQVDASTVALWRLDDASFPPAVNSSAAGSAYNLVMNIGAAASSTAGLIADGGTALSVNASCVYRNGEVAFTNATSTVTYEAWVRPLPGFESGPAAQGIVAHAESTGTTGGLYLTNGGKLAYKTNSGWWLTDTSATTLQANTTYHVGFTRQYSDATHLLVTFYVDGIPVSASSTTPVVTVNPSQFFVVGGCSVTTTGFTGVIDDVRIKNVAQTDAQMLADYQRGVPTLTIRNGVGVLDAVIAPTSAYRRFPFIPPTFWMDSTSSSTKTIIEVWR